MYAFLKIQPHLPNLWPTYYSKPMEQDLGFRHKKFLDMYLIKEQICLLYNAKVDRAVKETSKRKSFP